MLLSPLPSNSQQIVLLQIKDGKPIVFTPKLLKWDQISLPDELEIPNSVPPAQIERRDIDQIMKDPDGRVILPFQSRSIREDSFIPKSSTYRRSFFEYSLMFEPLDNSQQYRFYNPIIEPIINPASLTDSVIGSEINIITKKNFKSISLVLRKIIIPLPILPKR